MTYKTLYYFLNVYALYVAVALAGGYLIMPRLFGEPDLPRCFIQGFLFAGTLTLLRFAVRKSQQDH